MDAIKLATSGGSSAALHLGREAVMGAGQLWSVLTVVLGGAQHSDSVHLGGRECGGTLRVFEEHLQILCRRCS